MTWIVIITAVFLAGGVLGAFLTLVFGIHSEERHMSLKSDPHTRSSATTRRLLAHVQTPDDNMTKFAV
jgi:hypothetical protein